MKVVIDNNIAVDAFNPNPEFEAVAQEIFRLATIKKFDGFVTANSLTDIFYVLRKTHGTDKAKAIIKKLPLMLDIIGTAPADCITALEKPMNDFEDALVETCAKKVGADYIVSRDQKFINAAIEVKVIKPDELLAML